ncbi:MAG: hypothetical protein WCW03_01995 [Candidatus Paceibacterota bacterium]|jgi:hypothetical protein
MEKPKESQIIGTNTESAPILEEDGISIAQNHKRFIEGITARMKEANEEEIGIILTELERYSQSPDRRIEIYTDPQLDTFCCGQVPSKIINSKGEIVDDSNRISYLIGVPFQYVAGGAEMDFLRGEILHEQGHAIWTDFSRWKRFETLAQQEGYDPQELLQLNNCIEDPRMERLVGGPLHENERKQLLTKNRDLIIPSIAEGIRKKKGGKDGKEMTPTEQFKFILKIERLWELHRKDLEGIEKPWSLDDLDPSVRDEYEKIAPYLAQITGDSIKPAMKVNPEVEKIIVEHIWPAYKRLIDKFPEQESSDSSDGKSERSGGKGKGKRGASSGKPEPPELQTLDPSDPSTWPPKLQKIFQKMVEQHNKRLKQESERTKEKSERQSNKEDRLKKELNNLQKIRDGFEDPETREKYNQIKSEVASAISQIKRIFDRFLPKIDEPQYEYSRKGIRFSVKNLVRRYGTGAEKPLGKRVTPEKNALVLHLLIDVSGSMYSGKRIENAIKACVAVCEASEDHNISIEILANDQNNVTDDLKYLIKKFNEGYSGSVKTRLVSVLDAKKSGFGGDNQDALAIDASVPRLKKEVQKKRVEADRTGSLTIYISDSTTDNEDTKRATDEARLQTPFEGTAITPEADVATQVRKHFGPDSLVPPSIEEFPGTIQKILERHISHLRQME